MKFTIEASVLGNGQYRLQDDKSWRYLNNRDIRPNDLTYPDLASTRRFIDPVDTVNLGNCLYKVNPKTSSLEDKVAFISQRLSRDKPPREFTEDELKSVIAFGDDSKNNTLILDLEGNFALTDLSYAMGPYNPVAVRRETFCAGNDCVGSSAADDDQHIQTIYKMMLYGWHAHLITGELRMLIDEFGRSSKEGLLAQITEVRERLQAKPL